MKRLRALVRCIWHAVQPPFWERWRTGECHYQPAGGEHWTWRRHAWENLGEAARLALFLPVDREFHQL